MSREPNRVRETITAGLAAVLLCLPLATASADERVAGEGYDCIVEPLLTVKLGSREQGTIATMNVKRGSTVKKAEPVAALDSELQKLAVDVARIRAGSDLDIQSAKAKLTLADAELARARELHVNRVVASKKLDEAAIDQAVATIAYKTAQLQYQIAQSELAQAVERSERRVIRSPVDGVVTELTMSPGEYVHEQAVVMTIAMLDPLKIETFVPIARYRDVHPGTLAEIEMAAPIDEVRRAAVVVVDRVFDAASGTFGVRLEMPNPDYRLPGGFRCKVRFLKNVAGAAIPGGGAGGERPPPPERAPAKPQ